jgi:hypothetical protein
MRRYDHGPGDELAPAEREVYVDDDDMTLSELETSLARYRVSDLRVRRIEGVWYAESDDLRVRRIEGVWYAESDRLIAAGEGGTLLAAIKSLLAHADERLW